ncbi:MAG: LppC family lipoprotein, partial [Methylophaga sp.]|nr:LppC family lipoprotein [Methylophaga sp.]
KENLFQFGLAPEDDAIAAANYASQQDYQRTVVISPANNWGKRIATAFSDQWLENGGILLNHTNYDAKQHDFSATIKPLLGLETSTQRYHSLKQTLGGKLEFEPRRRQDIDFVFIVAKPLKARQLLPQLKFHRSGSLPVIATSHAFSGKENSQQDIDLNGLFINDIPWMFTDTAVNDPIYTSLQSNPPKNFERYLRLHALGADAYQLIPQLNSLSRSSDLSFAGATGILSITESGQVHRETRWGKFSHGILTALPDTIE